MRSAMATPANTPSSFTINWLLPISVAGMQQSVVWSPSPMSSAKANRINSAINCSFVSCKFILLNDFWAKIRIFLYLRSLKHSNLYS